ncbi:AAA family ATPase [Acidobacteriota bacterium]
MNNKSLLEAALYYRYSLGFSVIPVMKDKKPYIAWEPYQKKKATKEEIKGWWKHWPNANIGIVTGKISELVVIDVDTEEGNSELNKILPDTFLPPMVKTPRGGKHFYCRYVDGLRNNTGAIEGCDLRAEGGYIIAPPSDNGNGIKYEWMEGLVIDETEIPDIPESYIEFIKNHKEYSLRNNECGMKKSTKMFGKGRRDDDLFHVANSLVKGGMLEEEVEAVTRYLAKKCDPPFSEKEAKIKVESALKRALKREATFEPILTNLDTITPQPVEWLWFNRIPLGKLSLLVGDPGQGKSFLSVYMAAHITTGKPWPDIGEPNLKGSVIMITAEDGIADTVRIRADAAGADVEKIRILEGVTTEKGEFDFFNLIKYLPALEKAIHETKDVRLVILDPITSYLGIIDSHKNSAVRGALTPLVQLAEKYKIAVVAISHLNKNIALNAIYRTMGSLAFTAAARAVWVVSRDEGDENKSRRFFMPLKTNLSIEPTCLAFSIKDSQVVFEDQPVDINPEEVLSNDKSEDKSALNQAISWLKEALEDGPIASNDLNRMAEENRISKASLRRAKEKLGVESYKEGVLKDQKWFWRLSGG